MLWGRFYSAGSQSGRTLSPPVQLTGLPRLDRVWAAVAIGYRLCEGCARRDKHRPGTDRCVQHDPLGDGSACVLSGVSLLILPGELPSVMTEPIVVAVGGRGALGAWACRVLPIANRWPEPLSMNIFALDVYDFDASAVLRQPSQLPAGCTRPVSL